MEKLESKTSLTPKKELKTTNEIARNHYKQSIGNISDEILMRRYIPVDIYMDTDDLEALESVNEAVKEILNSMDVDICTLPEIFKGSIIEKFWAVTKSITSNIDLIKKGVEAIKSFKLNRKDPLKKHSISTKNPKLKLPELLNQLEDIPNISIRIGNLLITKSTSRDIPLIQAKNLSKEEVIILDNNPSILRNPKTIHNKLNTIKKNIMLNKNFAMNL